MKQLTSLGFEKNTKVINGHIPHFKKGDDILVLIGADYWISKISKINHAFENHQGNVYGLLTDDYPIFSDKDWVTAPNLTLIKLNPVVKGRWNKHGTDLEFIPTTL